MRSVFKTFQEQWKMLQMGIKITGSPTGHVEERVSHMIFADNCLIFVESKEQIFKMIGDATEELKKKGLDWKEDQMELISWGLDEKIGDLKIEEGGKEHVIKEVDSLKTLGAIITKKADSKSAMKFRMNKAGKAMWMDMKFYKNKGIAEVRTHRRYREVVQSCVLHSCESWSWNKETVDALHGWESKNLDLVS